MNATDRKGKMLEKVRLLLAKADSTTFPAEAESFRAKADELMTAYAIEQWQVEEATAGATERPKPEVRHFDFSWWNRHPQGDQLWDMFHSVAYHCRCVVALRGYRGRRDGMPVIGLASDLDYFDLLFTHLMLQMSRELVPVIKPSESADANVYRLRQAGVDWMRIAEMLYGAGLVKLTPADRTKLWMGTPDEPEWKEINKVVRDRLKNRLANYNRRYIAANRLQSERNYVHPGVYQRSYAEGFVTEVSDRLRTMRRQSEDRSKGSGMELVIQDIRTVAVELYNEMYPMPEDDGKKRKGTSVSREVAFDYSAYNSGRAAGARADLSNKPGQRLGGRKGLPS